MKAIDALLILQMASELIALAVRALSRKEPVTRADVDAVFARMDEAEENWRQANEGP